MKLFVLLMNFRRASFLFLLYSSFFYTQIYVQHDAKVIDVDAHTKVIVSDSLKHHPTNTQVTTVNNTLNENIAVSDGAEIIVFPEVKSSTPKSFTASKIKKSKFFVKKIEKDIPEKKQKASHELVNTHKEHYHQKMHTLLFIYRNILSGCAVCLLVNVFDYSFFVNQFEFDLIILFFILLLILNGNHFNKKISFSLKFITRPPPFVKLRNEN